MPTIAIKKKAAKKLSRTGTKKPVQATLLKHNANKKEDPYVEPILINNKGSHKTYYTESQQMFS
jgi:hypothetical protein